MSLPQGWEPSLNKNQVRYYLDYYKGKSQFLSDEQTQSLEMHAQHYNLPYYPGDFSILEAVKQAGAGFVEGFTTINPGVDHPDNTYEQIARNLGHLVGFAPSLAAAPLKAAGALNLANKIATVKSIPMKGADIVTDYTKTKLKAIGLGSVGRNEALKTANTFLNPREVAKHVTEGAFHLGTASAISAWRGGVDEMMHGFVGGAQAGGIFRVIGNLTPGTSAHERIGKAVAGSLFMGLPATQRGATTPEQVYEYVMGAYFGGNEVSWSRAKAGKFMKKMTEKAEKDEKWATQSGMDPEMHPEYADLPEPVKPILKEMAKNAWGDFAENQARGFLFTQLMGQQDKITAETLKLAGMEATDEYIGGDRVYKLSPEYKKQFKSFVMSGGKKGSDTAFAKAAEGVGIPSIHFTFGKHQKGIKAPGYKRILTLAELEDTNTEMTEANLTLNRKIGKLSPDTKNLIRKNAYNVRFSDAVYGVGEITQNGKQVKGSTGWTAQMGIDKGIPVHIFDQKINQWFTWNHRAQRFTIRAGMPPRPPARFTGVGTENLIGSGKKAINDLFSHYWMPTTTVTEKVAEIDKKSPEIAKTKKRLFKIAQEKSEIEQELLNIADEILIATNAGKKVEEIDIIAEPQKALERQLTRLTEEQNRLSNIGVQLESTEIPKDNRGRESKVSNEEISELSDIDKEVIDGLRVGKRSIQFAEQHLSNLWGGRLPQEVPLIRAQAADKIRKILEEKDITGEYKFIRYGSKENLSDQWAKEVERQFSLPVKEGGYGIKIKLTPEAKGEMRQWMTRENTGKVVRHLQSDGKNVYSMSDNMNPKSLAGNRKMQMEPEKRIDVTYRESGGGNEPAYIVLDHVTIKTDKGRKVDYDLSRYREYLIKNTLGGKERDKWSKNDADKDYNQFVSNSMKRMNQENYYYFSGRGDGDKMFWVKYHPQMPKENYKKGLDNIIKEGSKLDKNFKADYQRAQVDFLAKYANRANKKEMLEMFEKQYISNVMYDLSMNGMDITTANIKKILGSYRNKVTDNIISKDQYDKLSNIKQKDYLKMNFINKSSAFNKRSQIWFTNGWAGDKKLINNEVSDLSNNNYKYMIAKDLSDKDAKLKHNLIKLLNNQLPEHVDGAILVRDGVLKAMNKDFGTESSIGQNKSFIVSPNAEHGALLGKFMFHSAGKELSKMMRDKGLHMIMQESAVKQHGTREIGDYKVGSKGLDLMGSKTYELSPEHVFGSFGVYGNRHMLENQRIPKQLLSNLIPNAFSKVNQEVIDKAFESIVGERWAGDITWNNKVSEYLTRLSSGEATKSELRTLENNIIDNIDKVGIEKIVDAMKAEYADGLTQKIYDYILKTDKNWVVEEFRDGKINESELKSYNENVGEFHTTVDRVIKLANEWVATEQASGRDMSSAAIYMHKFVRDFRMKAVQNFLLNSATKPKRNNSLSAFMRPYDKAMQENIGNVNDLLKKNNTEGINYKDDIFFLDNAFKHQIIKTDIKGVGDVSLETLFQLSKTSKGKKKKEIDEVLTAVTVRVPMDSMSGAQIARFGGFTGRDGHGILLHGRAMRAEGGADLDGDKSFVFFGGRGGFKKEWKDAFLQNKEEFYKGKGANRSVGDNKTDIIEFGKNKGKRFDEVLGLELSKEQSRRYNSLAYQYAPNERMRISQAAVEGRGQLGPAVTQKQTLTATYNAIVAGGGEDKFNLRLKDKKGKWKNYDITIQAKQSKKDEAFQRSMGRAQIGLASDPLDVLGLKGRDAWFKEMWNAHFKIINIEKSSLYGKPGKLSKAEMMYIMKNLDKNPNSLKKGGVLSDFLDLNKAYWGRNWADNRKYNMHEIKDLGSSVYNLGLDPKRINTVMAKTGQLFHNLDWSDSVFGRINETKLKDRYDRHQADLDKYDWLKGILGRASFKTISGNYIDNTMTKKLWTEDGLNEHSKSVKKFKEAVKGTLFAQNKDLMLEAADSKEKRKDILIQIKNLAEDYIVNDMTDLTSLNNISNVVEKMIAEKDPGMTSEALKTRRIKNINETIEHIHKRVEYLKRSSYLMARDRKQLKAYEDLDLTGLTSKERRNLQELYRLIEEQTQAGRTIKQAKGQELTSELDLMEINTQIDKYKKTLTESGKRLFDQLMLGSFNRFDLSKIDNLINQVGKWDKVSMDLLHNLRSQASKTSVSKLGFDSASIPDISVKEHIGSYLTNFNEMWRRPTDKSINKAVEGINKEVNKPENEAKGLPDKQLDDFIGTQLMHTGYEGLKEGKLDKESKSLVGEIATMLKTYNNKVGQDLNELVRGLDFIGKDLNAMNKQDYVKLRNWLHEMKRGGFVQRMFGKKGPVTLAKRHWALFPEAINRELMRDELVLMRERGFFTDRTGARQEGAIVRPTNYVDIVHKWIERMTDLSVGTADGYIKDFNQRMLFHTGVKDSNALWTIAVRQRELRTKKGIMKSEISRDEKKQAIAELYTRYNEANKEFKYDKKLKNKTYFVTIDGKRKELSGEQIVKEIDTNIEKTMNDMYQFISGQPGALDMYVMGYYDKAQQAPIYDHAKFIRHLQSHMVGGQSPWGTTSRGEIPTQFGIDGLRKIARSMMLDLFPNTKEGQADKLKIALQPVVSTREIIDGYFPHMFFESSTAGKAMSKAVKSLINTPLSEFSSNLKEAETKRNLEIKKVLYRYKALEGDWVFKDMEEFENFDAVLEDIAKGKRAKEETIRWFNANERAGSMHSRSSNTGGWSIDPIVVESYIRSLSNTYYRQLSQMFSRNIIDRMGKEMPKKWGLEQTQAWQNFMKLYTQDAMGNPSVIPQKLIDDPKMKLKGTPYAWWADNKVRDRINKIGSKLGLVDKTLPEELRGIDLQTLRQWSNLEAQYQMATLLAHPKSMVANVFGGTAHTLQNVGIRTFMNATNYQYLSRINPKWTNKEAVNDFVISQGVLPEFLVYEFGLQKEFQNTKGKNFLGDLRSKLARDPDMSETSVIQLAQKHGLKDKVTNFAAKFMSTPEKMLRRQSFMAHYIKAWEKYGGAIKEFDHPFLIEQAKKGVKATQFLYNAPNRPAFARTAAGKVMSRFQLWAWNSVRFRNDIKRMGRIHGYRPGTDAAKRYERTLQLDLFVFALANAFAYSLFESNLPQPYGWVQDFSDWIFGDEKERDRAFYGSYPTSVAPLQAVTPPAFRLTGPTFKAILDDDWSRMSQYYIYTMFPFGRMIRDVSPYAKGNLIDVPTRAWEKLLGFPMRQLQTKITKAREDEEAGIDEDLLYPGSYQ